MKYKIIKTTWVSKHGHDKSSSFYIKYEKTILWGYYSYWRYETHTEGSPSGSYQVRTSFSTVGEATTFALNILCKNKIRGAHRRNIVDSGTCKTEENVI